MGVIDREARGRGTNVQDRPAGQPDTDCVMRRIVTSTYISLDGVYEDPAWSAPYWSDEAQQFAHDQLFASGALLLGRKTYEVFAASWPTPEWLEREGISPSG
jgi:RibD C-terminal domain